MKTFLKYVARDILEKYGNNLSDIAIVFPNKEEQGAPEKKTEEKKNDSDKPQIDTKKPSTIV